MTQETSKKDDWIQLLKDILKGIKTKGWYVFLVILFIIVIERKPPNHINILSAIFWLFIISLLFDYYRKKKVKVFFSGHLKDGTEEENDNKK